MLTADSAEVSCEIPSLPRISHPTCAPDLGLTSSTAGLVCIFLTMLTLTALSATAYVVQNGFAASSLGSSRVASTTMQTGYTKLSQMKTSEMTGSVVPTSGAADSYIIDPSLTEGKQDFLEADPYWDQSTVPVNTYKNKAPFTAKVISVKRIVGPQATGETCHIIMNHEGKMPYWEGQVRGRRIELATLASRCLCSLLWHVAGSAH